MSDAPGAPSDRFARLFEGAASVESAGACFALAGGQTLFAAGEPASAFYVLRTGRLGVLRQMDGQAPLLLGVIRPGEPAGEMALLADTAHTATVMALRDSEVFALPRAAFFAEAARDPRLMADVAQLMIRRARQPLTPMSTALPTVFSLIGCEATAARVLAGTLADALQTQGSRTVVAGAEALSRPTAWFSELEASHNLVLYAAEHGETEWIERCGRQADRLLLLGRGDRAPPRVSCAITLQAIRRQRSADLVLLQPAAAERFSGTAAWQASSPVARTFHVRDASGQDAARLARILTGRSVGLVMSGGGARAYAHVGVIAALREARAPIDLVGGASMGAVIGAGLAMGWDDREIEERIRDAFVRSSPLRDMALPLLAMTQGKVVRERLEAHFGEARIEDLRLPFFCVSSNLTSGQLKVHRTGRLADALRASIALPGVLPPVVDGEDVLVDGAVMRNLPSEIMRAGHDGPVIGVDVSRARGLSADDVARPSSVWRWVGDWPGIGMVWQGKTFRYGC